MRPAQDQAAGIRPEDKQVFPLSQWVLEQEEESISLPLVTDQPFRPIEPECKGPALLTQGGGKPEALGLEQAHTSSSLSSSGRGLMVPSMVK